MTASSACRCWEYRSDSLQPDFPSIKYQDTAQTRSSIDPVRKYEPRLMRRSLHPRAVTSRSGSFTAKLQILCGSCVPTLMTLGAPLSLHCRSLSWIKSSFCLFLVTPSQRFHHGGPPADYLRLGGESWFMAVLLLLRRSLALQRCNSELACRCIKRFPPRTLFW